MASVRERETMALGSVLALALSSRPSDTGDGARTPSGRGLVTCCYVNLDAAARAVALRIPAWKRSPRSERLVATCLRFSCATPAVDSVMARTWRRSVKAIRETLLCSGPGTMFNAGPWTSSTQ